MKLLPRIYIFWGGFRFIKYLKIIENVKISKKNLRYFQNGALLQIKKKTSLFDLVKNKKTDFAIACSMAQMMFF